MSIHRELPNMRWTSAYNFRNQFDSQSFYDRWFLRLMDERLVPTEDPMPLCDMEVGWCHGITIIDKPRPEEPAPPGLLDPPHRLSRIAQAVDQLIGQWHNSVNAYP